MFVHHSAIYAPGFKTLAEGEELEFDIETDENGRKKAVNVTGPGGAPVKVKSFQSRNFVFCVDCHY